MMASELATPPFTKAEDTAVTLLAHWQPAPQPVGVPLATCEPDAQHVRLSLGRSGPAKTGESGAGGVSGGRGWGRRETQQKDTRMR